MSKEELRLVVSVSNHSVTSADPTLDQKLLGLWELDVRCPTHYGGVDGDDDDDAVAAADEEREG